MILGVVLYFQYSASRSAGINTQMLFESRYTWFESMNIQYAVGVDGISVAMILLTSVIVLAGMFISWKIENQVHEFFFLLSSLSIGAYGFFISLDLFTLFFFLELAVIPKFLLIGVWGSGHKEYSAMKLALMLMGGSALILTGILMVYFNSNDGNGQHTFDILTLAKNPLSGTVQNYAYILLFLGFGVFTAMFPFHSWAPDGHSSAPTAASMFLAGISMKLGGYGCLRVATYLLPDAAKENSTWVILLAVLAIVYGSLATLMQKDLKYINAYSSIAHCGFVILGIGMLNHVSLTGAVLQMVSHGLMTALFFGAIGMIYERTHTRMVDQLGGLLKVIPFIGVVFVMAGMASLGLPGLSGFVAEMTVFVGSWQRTGEFERCATVLACASIVVTAVYILRAAGRSVMGPFTNEEHTQLKDASWNEKSAAFLLIAAILLVGMMPFWLVNLVQPDMNYFVSFN
jgi:NADH-quinone oxidoreductase subunit M